MKVNDLVDKIQKYSEDADIRMIVDAYLYSAQSHTGQKRKSGEAYLTHPLASRYFGRFKNGCRHNRDGFAS